MVDLGGVLLISLGAEADGVLAVPPLKPETTAGSQRPATGSSHSTLAYSGWAGGPGAGAGPPAHHEYDIVEYADPVSGRRLPAVVLGLHGRAARTPAASSPRELRKPPAQSPPTTPHPHTNHQ